MKNLLTLIVLVSTNIYSQSFTETSHKYYILNEEKTDWIEPIITETNFEISAKIITYNNKTETQSFRVISSDDDTSYDEGDLVFHLFCLDSKNKDVEIILTTNKECEKYIYFLSEEKSLTFNIN